MNSTGLTFAIDQNTLSSERRLRSARSAPPVPYRSPDWDYTVKSGHAWPPREAKPTDLDELCGWCKMIDFQEIFDPITASTRGSTNYRTLVEYNEKDFLKNAPCELCRFFHSLRWPLFYPHTIVISTWPPLRVQNSVPSSLVVCWNPTHYSLTSFPFHIGFHPDRIPVLSITQGEGLLSYLAYDMGRTRHRDAYCVPELTVPLDYDYQRWSSIPGKALRVLPLRINYKLIQAWLNRCDQAHTKSCCPARLRYSVPMSCIDCNTREIVTMNAGDEYFALSYVWGDLPHPSTAIKERKDGRLFIAGTVATVIEDAITVVKNLGKRYLWVDQLCINQHSDTDKKRQIDNMHNIYEGAYATIVAAAGSDSSFGLPGVSQMPRMNQLYVKTTSFSLVGSLPLLSEALRKTTWCTRGWTYQEAVLSRRLIIFTEHQVYFLCPVATWGEDNVADEEDLNLAGDSDETRVLGTSMFQASWFDVVGREAYYDRNIGHLLTHINKFCQRTLSYEADMLNAIRGLLSRSDFYTYYGLLMHKYEPKNKNRPYQTPNMRLLLESLMFTFVSQGNAHLADVTRRIGLPSWSWVGWKSHSGIFLGSLELSKKPHTTTDRVWAEGKSGTLVPILDLLPPSSSAEFPRLIPELSRFLWIESSIIQVGFHIGKKTQSFYQVCFCFCHPLPNKRRSPVVWPWKNPKQDCEEGQPADFCHRPRKVNDPMHVRMLTESWDCLLLARSSSYACFLIIDWSGDTAYRVGTLNINCSDEQFEDLLERVPHYTRKVRLG